MPLARRLVFPPYTLDPLNEQLWCESQRLRLRPRTYAVLLFLAQNPQRLITKEELLKNVWGEVSVSGGLLRGYIHELRQALGDRPKASQYIETIPARGYRFLPKVLSDPFSEAGEDGSTRLPPAPQRSSAVTQVERHVEPITVGIVHSLTGIMAWSESPVIDATLLAIDEINQRGGILGRPVQARIADGQSNPASFSMEAEQLITQEKVCALFGCWGSASRKAVMKIVEQHDHLLIYPARCEGLEQSPNILYTGATPNQQVIPAVHWTVGFLRKKRFFLVGWNAVYSHATNAVIHDEVNSLDGEIVGEEYLDIHRPDAPKVVRMIARSKPDLIFNSLAGDMNVYYTRLLRAAGVTPDKIPTVYFCISEIELLSLSPTESMGDYSAWNYFQSLDRPENHAFVNRFQSRYGPRRVVADPMEAGYLGVHLWAKAVETAGSDEVPAIRQALKSQSIEAPEGPVKIDPENNHLWKTFRLGKVNERRQFEIISSSEEPIRPEVFPSSRSPAAWHAFLEALFRRWGGHWYKPPP